MSKDDSESIAKELAKQLPIKDFYSDAIAPPARQSGALLEDLVKTLRLALAPFQFAAAGQDRLRDFIDKSVRRVPEKDRLSPAPQILGPVVEGIRYEPEDTPIDEMFSQLLSTSMDQSKVNRSHPSYPHIIKQLSADEARILKLLAKQQFEFVQVYNIFGSISRAGPVEVDTFPRDTLTFPENLSFYMDHLHQLGLAGVFEVPPQEPLYSEGRQTGARVRSMYRLTVTGERFVSACVPGE